MIANNAVMAQLFTKRIAKNDEKKKRKRMRTKKKADKKSEVILFELNKGSKGTSLTAFLSIFYSVSWRLRAKVRGRIIYVLPLRADGQFST